MMLFSDVRSRSVISVSGAETVGTIAACTIAASPSRVAGFRLKTRGMGGHVLPWDDVLAMGNDAVTIRSAENLQAGKDVDSADPVHKSREPLGKPLLTENGEVLGTVIDIDFDERTGRISRLISTEAEIRGDQILGTGTFALVVGAD
ncbi:PRC-barrel domain-containing protein [Streptomyces sp. SCSIO 30461]|uniref:PRC-barrel domain-containing protein n=1 Tax=Streptomyces sp. SCSIO 30461 TaxID=3118085 RepID=UPI0030D29099